MALPASGQISLNDVNVELGNSATAQIGLGDAAVRGLFGVASGQISMSDGYGKSSETTLTSAGTVNGEEQRQQITISDFISSGGTLVIPSNIWVWSDSTSSPALTIDVPCTIKNSGKIIGKGGNATDNAPTSGGPAIKINSGVTGVTIQNLSGAYIAGGGGGGRSGSYNGIIGGGGGGAGGGSGGSYRGGAGGSLNAVGADGTSTDNWEGYGGGAGGGGGFGNHYRDSANGGGGGGRILPGVGGGTSNNDSGTNGVGGGPGGSAGNAGTKAGTSSGWVIGGGGGGGGWGASGGLSNTGGGAVGGNAVDDSGVSYTLSNSGTIYGGT